MKNVYDLALIGLADLLVSAGNPSAPRQPARQQDEYSPAGDEDQEGVHGSVLALIAPLLIHGALEAGVADGDEKEHRTSASHQGADDAQEVEEEVAHGLGLGTRGASLNKRFERHLASGEVAHGEHELRRHAVVSHLRDAARRDAESISERFGSAALCFEPSFEIHGASLEQPKRLSQGFSKPQLFMLD